MKEEKKETKKETVKKEETKRLSPPATVLLTLLFAFIGIVIVGIMIFAFS